MASALNASLRILHVITSFDPVIGGPAEVIRNITLEHDKLAIRSEVLCLDEPDASFLRKLSVTSDVHALGHTDAYWFYNPRLIGWLRANIDRFDTIITHGLWLYPSFAVNTVIQEMKGNASRRAEHTRIPRLLVFPHGMLDPYFQRGGRWLKAIRNLIYWKLVEQRVVNGADALLFTCETELLLARQTFSPYQPRREINVGNGIVDPPPFTEAMTSAFAAKCPQVVGSPYLLFMSRIHHKKGVDLLIRAYAALVDAHTSGQPPLPRLVVAGPGLDSPYGETITQSIQKHPLLASMVFCPGMLTGDEKWGAIYGCDAFVLPSHQENFGIVVAEALACGKPVLISRQVNIWREVEQGNSGLVDIDSVAGTQRTLNQWIRMPEPEKQAMIHNARKTYEMHFRMQQVISRLNNVLTSPNPF